jgi:hypothetical protein
MFLFHKTWCCTLRFPSNSYSVRLHSYKKNKGTNDHLQNTTQKTKDRATGTPLKPERELRWTWCCTLRFPSNSYSVRLHSYCFVGCSCFTNVTCMLDHCFQRGHCNSNSWHWIHIVFSLIEYYEVLRAEIYQDISFYPLSDIGEIMI